MLKIAGSVIVIGATTLIGIKQAEDTKESYRQMQMLEQLICRIYSEIRYQRSYLGEIFSQTGRDAKPPYAEWLSELGRKLEQRGGGTFGDIWENAVETHLQETKLPKKEIARLAELGNSLGYADMEYQKKTMELYLAQLGETMEEVREEMKIKIRLCHCLGVMSGMLITVLLL